MQSDFFTQYANNATPRAVQRKETRASQKERDRIQAQQDAEAILSKAARAADRAWREKTIAECEDPAAMESIIGWLKRTGPDDGEAIVETVTQAAGLFKGPDARRMILQAVDKASCRIRRKLGLRELDDPLPPETNVFFECQEILR